MNRKSLGQILAGFELFSGLAGGKKATTETTTETVTETKEETSEKSETESESEGEKTQDPEKKAETQKVETTKEASSLQIGNAVSMSLEDYDKLLAMASLAIEATEENKGLKGKADRWDAYQAALGGGKPSSDSVGAKADDSKADDSVKDEHADLRKKHGALMAGI